MTVEATPPEFLMCFSNLQCIPHNKETYEGNKKRLIGCPEICRWAYACTVTVWEYRWCWSGGIM